jgi:uncharacterized protein (DUF58 family)
LLALALPVIVYLGAGLLYAPGKLQLEVQRRVEPQRADHNTPVEVHLTVTNQGPDIEELLLEDLAPPGLEVITGETCLLASLATGASIQLSYTLQGQRGLYRFQGVRATAGDRLGILQHTKILPAPGQIFVLPQAPRVRHVAIRPRETRVYSGSIPARQGGSGVEFFGLRSYQPGDPLRHINWRASARYDERLFSNEFEQERAADVGLVLDARRRSNIVTAKGSLFEHQVIAAAAIAQALLQDGNRVGLLVYGAYMDWTYPGYGKIQRERILQALARAQPGDSMVFDKLEKLPTRVFPPRSQMVLISTLLRDDLAVLVRIRALGYPVLVVSPDPVAYMEKTLKMDKSTALAIRLARLERELLFNRLRHAGIQVLNWDVSTPFDQAMQLALSRTPRWYHRFTVGV